MHRTLQISLPSENADGLSSQLQKIDGVIGLSHARGESIKPSGDVLTVHVLNRAADEVLRAVAQAGQHGSISVVTSEAIAFIDPEHHEKVRSDVDEGIWEEMEAGLRHQGRVTPNFLALMALGGAVAAVGLVSSPVSQTIAFIASALIAPGYETLAKVPLGALLGQWQVVRRGLISSLCGYAVLILGAALMFGVLLALNESSAILLARNPEVRTLSLPGTKNLSYSILGGIAGMTMIAAYRRNTIAGPLLLLSIIPAAALIGAGAVCGQWGLMKQGIERVLIDVLIIWATGALVVWIKQSFTHQRKPIV